MQGILEDDGILEYGLEPEREEAKEEDRIGFPAYKREEKEIEKKTRAVIETVSGDSRDSIEVVEIKKPVEGREREKEKKAEEGEKKEEKEEKEKKEGEEKKDSAEVKQANPEEMQEIVEVYFEYFEREFGKINRQLENLALFLADLNEKNKNESEVKKIEETIKGISEKLTVILKGSEKIAGHTAEKLAQTIKVASDISLKVDEKINQVNKEIKNLKNLIFILYGTIILLAVILLKLFKPF